MKSPVLSGAVHLALFGTLGIALTGGFLVDLVLPIKTGVVLLFAVAAYAFVFPAAPSFGILSRVLVLIYVLPFSVLLGYLVERDYVWMLTPRGLEIIQDRVLVAEMIAIGTIGLVGLFLGLRAGAMLGARHTAPRRSTTATRRTLSLPVYLPLLVAALGLSWLSAPKETIFQGAYVSEQSATAADKVNFPAAFLVSYVLLLVLALDLEHEANRSVGRLKLVSFLATLAYVVVVLQLLRGNRESSGLVLAVLGLFVTAPLLRDAAVEGARRARRRSLLILAPLLLLIAVFIGLGEARGTYNEVSARLGVRETLLLGLSQNTWTAVLWTNLSAMWEYREGLLRYKYGQTYLDYVASLPPGFVTRALGVNRRVEQWSNLNFEDPAGVSAGGLHIVIAPFKNFGAPGALLILAMIGFLVARVEQAHMRGGVFARLLWAGMLCSSFLWFWYGDMPFIRAMMAVVLVFAAYQVLLALRVRAPRKARPAAFPSSLVS